MIKEIIDYTNGDIKALNIFKSVSGLCQFVEEEQVDKPAKRFPAEYKGNDELKDITEYDFKNGAIFHLKNGTTNIEVLESQRANKEKLKYTTPIRCYFIHARKVIDDSAYTAYQMATNLVNTINLQDLNSLRPVLKVQRIQVIAKSYSTDSEEIENVFQNMDIQFRHDLFFGYIDYDIEIEGYQECFINYKC